MMSSKRLEECTLAQEVILTEYSERKEIFFQILGVYLHIGMRFAHEIRKHTF